MKKWFLIVFLLVTTISSFIFAFKTDNAPAYYLAMASLIAFCLAYAVEVLDYRVGGQHISLEKRLNVLAEGQEELKEVASSLLSIIYISQDGAQRWDGTPPEHQTLIEKHIATISKHIDPNLIRKVKKDIVNLDKLINERNKKR